ncbi:ParM/StbA family protein [Paraliobacillus ryukyuensis]|uniref:ParM/StbA family protein n=1 Tax=Paraliobacillus ryukyuensis TaxID=200904 RepID=UPI0009A5AEA0|nr:ParM/StbA family protein [Paraliobacillus ryukyuensis]
MKISRMNIDFGNSMYMNLMDGYFFELPTNVVEVSKETAEGKFTTSIEEPEELKGRLLISTTIDGEERFFLVGAIAENEVLGNKHIKRIHNKVTSNIPYITFLAAVAYYHGIKKAETDSVDINYLSTMLPIWLLKQTTKFSDMQQTFANRFKGKHEVTILTPGMEKTLAINVVEAVCRIESEVARWSIKKNFDLEDNELADLFKDNDTILCDLGGGTDDFALLPAGLKAPVNRDSFDYNADMPFLDFLEKFRKEKLAEQFRNVRDLEQFIYKNIDKSKMERKDGNTGKKTDLTDLIKKALKEYAEIKITQIEDTFPAPKDKVYKYFYFGGVATVLREAIMVVTEEKYGQEISESNHIVADDARMLNLYGLEVLSRAEEAKKQSEV